MIILDRVTWWNSKEIFSIFFIVSTLLAMQSDSANNWIPLMLFRCIFIFIFYVDLAKREWSLSARQLCRNVMYSLFFPWKDCTVFVVKVNHTKEGQYENGDILCSCAAEILQRAVLFRFYSQKKKHNKKTEQWALVSTMMVMHVASFLSESPTSNRVAITGIL